MADYFADSPLENKLGISDLDKFRHQEEIVVSEKTAAILSMPLPDRFDEIYFKAIHKILFEDIYDFAGNFRTVNMIHSHNSVPFAQADFLLSESKRIFAGLSDANYLQNLPRNAFAKELAKLSTELNALHPFRDGNGRTIRLFLILLSLGAGYLLDYSEVSSQELIAADKKAFEGDEVLLEQMYTKIVTRL